MTIQETSFWQFVIEFMVFINPCSSSFHVVVDFSFMSRYLFKYLMIVWIYFDIFITKNVYITNTSRLVIRFFMVCKLNDLFFCVFASKKLRQRRTLLPRLGVVHKLRWQGFGFFLPPTPLRWHFLCYERWQKVDILRPPTYLAL